MPPPPVIQPTEKGLYCEAGDFYLDPWAPVPRAIISHAHADHLHPGSQAYLCSGPSLALVRDRLEEGAVLEAMPYGEIRRLGEAKVSLHPAGHILGSAQVRVEVNGEVWVFSGDYKRAPDPTCTGFEPVRCHTFITEATFALPIYKWEEPRNIFQEIYDWWEANRNRGVCSVLFCYTLGKAQRILAELTHWTERRVYIHGALSATEARYREQNIRLLPTAVATEEPKGHSFAGELVLAPVTAKGTVWMRRFGAFQTAFASGWMRVRGLRRKRHFDRGFALSDHADWPALLSTIAEMRAERVWTTHGYAEPLARYLKEKDVTAEVLPTRFGGEVED
jgi:putative mRNA 3-end processing factor